MNESTSEPTTKLQPTTALRADALVRTNRPDRYASQMARHFGHKCATAWTGETGFVEFEAGRCEMSAAPDGLHLRVLAPSAENLGRLEDALTRHLERWGEKDELRVAWVHPNDLEPSAQAVTVAP